MPVSKFPAQYNSTAPITSKDGATNTAYGRGLLNAMFQRTGGGDGIIPNVTEGMTATGSNAAGALVINQDWNWIKSSPPGSGVMIDPALSLKPGQDIVVQNADPSNTLNIYPPSGFQIDALGTNNPYQLAPNTQRTFKVFSANQMFSGGS